MQKLTESKSTIHEAVSIPAKFRAHIDGRLVAGERVLWCGRPCRQLADFTAYTLCVVIVVVFGSAAAIVGLVIRGVSLSSPLYGMASPLMWSGCIVFVIGLLLLIPSVAMLNVFYVVTNRRAFIWPATVVGIGAPRILYREDIAQCVIACEKAGIGDLILFRETIGTSEGPEIVEVLSLIHI